MREIILSQLRPTPATGRPTRRRWRVVGFLLPGLSGLLLLTAWQPYDPGDDHDRQTRLTIVQHQRTGAQRIMNLLDGASAERSDQLHRPVRGRDVAYRGTGSEFGGMTTASFV